MKNLIFLFFFFLFSISFQAKAQESEDSVVVVKGQVSDYYISVKKKKMLTGKVTDEKGQPQEVIDEKDLIIDVDNLTPIPTLLIEIGSKKEVERVRAVKMLVAYLKKGVNADQKEQITFALEIAQGDRSQRVREVVTDAMK